MTHVRDIVYVVSPRSIRLCSLWIVGAVKRYMLLEEASETFAAAGINLGLPPDVLAAGTASLLSKAWYFPSGNTAGGGFSVMVHGIDHSPHHILLGQPFLFADGCYGQGREQGAAR
jgi:hypothetical protein